MCSEKATEKDTNINDLSALKENNYAGKLYLDILFFEYKDEIERTRNINSRTGILISAVVVMISIFFQAIDLPTLIHRGNLLHVIIFSTAVSCTIICVVIMILALNIRDYDHFKVEPFLEEGSKNLDYNKATSFLVDALGVKIKFNREKNNDKANTYSTSLMHIMYITNFNGCVTNFSTN